MESPIIIGQATTGTQVIDKGDNLRTDISIASFLSALLSLIPPVNLGETNAETNGASDEPERLNKTPDGQPSRYGQGSGIWISDFITKSQTSNPESQIPNPEFQISNIESVSGLPSGILGKPSQVDASVAEETSSDKTPTTMPVKTQAELFQHLDLPLQQSGRDDLNSPILVKGEIPEDLQIPHLTPSIPQNGGGTFNESKRLFGDLGWIIHPLSQTIDTDMSNKVEKDKYSKTNVGDIEISIPETKEKTLEGITKVRPISFTLNKGTEDAPEGEIKVSDIDTIMASKESSRLAGTFDRVGEMEVRTDEGLNVGRREGDASFLRFTDSPVHQSTSAGPSWDTSKLQIHNKESMDLTLIRSIKLQQSSDYNSSTMFTLEATVEPEGIGELDIKLILDRGVINGYIKTPETVTADLIIRNIPEIINSLIRDGLNIGNLSVSVRDYGRGKEMVYEDRDRSDNRSGPNELTAQSYSSGYIDIFI